MKRYFSILVALVLLAVSVSVAAQVRTRVVHRGTHVVKENALVVQYVDSLQLYRIHLDSLSAVRDSLGLPRMKDDQLYRLFIPLSLYRSPTHHRLSLDGDSSLDDKELMIDQALMDIYLRRPDLVRSTQSRLDEVGENMVDEPTRVKVSPDIVKHVSPEPVEAEPLPQDIVILKPNFWSFSGDYYMQFLQNYVSSNWYRGGQSNYSMVASLTILANYNNKQKIKWDNKLEMKLGFQTQREDSLHSIKTSEDMIRYTGKLGLQATKKWYYTFQTIAQTQFMRSFRNNDRRVYSDFMSPITLNFSLGMDYNVGWMKNRLTGSIHLAPIACNYKYVDRLALSTRFGIDEGHHHLTDYGSEFNVDLTWKFTDNIRWKTRLYGYTTYERSELEWENTFTFQVNKYISSNFFVYPRFDDGSRKDDHHGYWQFKEYLSFGFSYSF